MKSAFGSPAVRALFWLGFGFTLWGTQPSFSEETRVWPFLDGSFMVREGGDGVLFALPYIPFLSSEPAWTPAYPRRWGQPPEPVRPLAGLGGAFRLGFRTRDGFFRALGPEGFTVSERTPYSATCTIRVDEAAGTLKWCTGKDEKGVTFLYSHAGTFPATLSVEIDGIRFQTLWAVPGKKQYRNWGRNLWRFDENLNALIHSYSNPIDATHDPCTALWFGGSVRADLSGEATVSVRIELPLEKDGKPVRFGFVHADDPDEIRSLIRDRRQETKPFSNKEKDWNTWTRKNLAKIETRFQNLEREGEKKRILAENLAAARLLFLSNGGVLAAPMTLDRFSLRVRDQGIALSHWFAMGLDFPNTPRWRELGRYNPVAERCIPVTTFSRNRLREILSRKGIQVIAPDPDLPPGQEEFDALLGFVIGGGKLTLVDGVFGFRDREGWWKNAGFQDLAEYALDMLGVPVEPDSRRILDEEGLSPDFNTFCGGFRVLDKGASVSPRQVSIETPGSGFLFLYPASSTDTTGVRIYKIGTGEKEILPFTADETEVLAASESPRLARDSFGIPVGREILGESFVAYRVPESSRRTEKFEITLSGGWVIAWNPELPETDHVLLKKAFQVWYLKELLSTSVSRLAHPVVYAATWSSRVFDVSGTEWSPVLYQEIGRGTFVWVGFPVDYLRLGTDGGTDRQNWLRKDPLYDLLRMTLALHDPKRGGSLQAGTEPLAGWGAGWSQSSVEGTEPDLPYFAWLASKAPARRSPGSLYWSWAFKSFSRAVRKPILEGETLEAGLLAVRNIPGKGRLLDFYTNACRYALCKGMEKQAERQNLPWWKGHLASRASKIEKSLIDLLKLNEDSPVLARWVRDGTPAEPVPLPALLPEAVWAVSEIPDSLFPGGGDLRKKILEVLVRDEKKVRGDPRAAAALATVVPPETRKKILERFPAEGGSPWSPQGGYAGYSISVAVPFLHALCLDGGT